ncbi:DUF2073 domain-containing protein [Candidatus Woesearchaeota archaeon]|nr:DUF2073 domain-containing protein [Candidatus Woesearchaeota archaeon]
MLTLQFVPYNDIENLSSAKRIQKILNIVKDDKIALMEGRLKKEEEKDLIEITMEEIDDKFKGVELAVIYPNKDYKHIGERMRKGFVSMLLGDRQGLTVVGPASIVKEIKKDPNKIELFTQDQKKKNGKIKKKR